MYVAGIYRQKNAVRFATFLRQQAARAQVALWGLDGEHPDLAAMTVGTGAGSKFELLNQILERNPPRPGDDIVVTDDDITLSPGGLRALLALGRRADFGLYQPAHGRHSTASHAITRRRHGVVARETTFVEIGPVFVVAPGTAHLVLPFPADAGMGWGLELQWTRLRDRGLRMGIVDAIRVDHPDTPGSTYADGVEASEKARERALLDELGLAKIAEAQQLIETWWPWQPRPPWRRARPAT
jgi:hypothetical protein